MIIREYKCNTCNHVFEHFHKNADEPLPDCPRCVLMAELSDVEKLPSVFKTRSTRAAQTAKAADTMYKIAEEDYGLTNMKDNLREGDIAAVMPKLPPELQKNADNFWQKNAMQKASLMSSARTGMALARAEGFDPIALLHKKAKKGSL